MLMKLKRIFWDTETTGLDNQNDRIIAIALIVEDTLWEISQTFSIDCSWERTVFPMQNREAMGGHLTQFQKTYLENNKKEKQYFIFETKVFSAVQSSESAYAVHRISAEAIKNAPAFSEVIKEIIFFLYTIENYWGKCLLHLKKNKKAEEKINAFVDLKAPWLWIAFNSNFDYSFMKNHLYQDNLRCDYFENGTFYDPLRTCRQIFINKRNNLDAVTERLGLPFSKRTYHDAVDDVRRMIAVVESFFTFPRLENNTLIFDIDTPIMEKMAFKTMSKKLMLLKKKNSLLKKA
jgi:DNA polymerase III epsilon subunit-like protein